MGSTPSKEEEPSPVSPPPPPPNCLQEVLTIEEARSRDWSENIGDLCFAWCGRLDSALDLWTIKVSYDKPSGHAQVSQRAVFVDGTNRKDLIFAVLDSIEDALKEGSLPCADVESSDSSSRTIVPFAHMLELTASKEHTSIRSCSCYSRYTPMQGFNTVDHTRVIEKIMHGWRMYRKRREGNGRTKVPEEGEEEGDDEVKTRAKPAHPSKRAKVIPSGE